MKLKSYIVKDPETGKYLCLNAARHYYYFSDNRKEAFVSHRTQSLETVMQNEFHSGFFIEELQEKD